MSAVAAPNAPTGPPEPQVLGESRYDKVTSLMMSMVFAAGLVVAWLGLIVVTNGGLPTKTLAKLNIIEVFGGGGGEEDGRPDQLESIDTGGAAGDVASNNMTDATAFEEPQLQKIPESLLDAVVDSAQQSADLAPSMDRGGLTASGERRSRVGTGGPALGNGPGDGGVPSHLRWSVLYTQGQTPEEYARQLDFLRVELGVIVDGKLQLASRFTQPTPARRTVTTGIGEDRLYFIWRGQGRKSADIELLRKAGIEVGDADVLQFYPKDVENAFKKLEVEFKGLSSAEIRSTVFRVVPNGDNYAIQVENQVPLRAGRG